MKLKILFLALCTNICFAPSHKGSSRHAKKRKKSLSKISKRTLYRCKYEGCTYNTKSIGFFYAHQMGIHNGPDSPYIAGRRNKFPKFDAYCRKSCD